MHARVVKLKHGREILVRPLRDGDTGTVEAVFDGAPDEFFPDGSHFMGVRVFYAERGSDADTRIKRLVEASRERRTLKVVTSDRALADYVRLCGAEVVRSGEFRRRLDAASAAVDESKASERVGVEASEMDEWMKYFGVAPEDDDEEARTTPQSAKPRAGRKNREASGARKKRKRL